MERLPYCDFAVVSQAIIAAMEPRIGERITAALFCLLQKIVQAMGTVAESTKIPTAVIMTGWFVS